MKESDLRRIISEEVNNLLKEDYARGIPDFALSQVASKACDDLMQHLKRHVSQVSQDPVKQRQMLQSANVVLQDLEVEMKELLEDKLLKFMRST